MRRSNVGGGVPAGEGECGWSGRLCGTQPHTAQICPPVPGPWLIAIRSAINYEDDQVFCTKSCNGQVFGHFSVALSYATHPYCTRVVKILLFQNAPGQTPVSQIAKLSAKAKGQEKRYIVSMSGANLSFLLGKVSVLTCYFFSIACGNRCGFKTISLAGIRAMLNPSKRVLGSMNWAIS